MRPKRGFVLVCVLWVLAILTVVAVGYGQRAMLDRRAAAYSLDHTEAMMMARAAVHRGVVAVKNKLRVAAAAAQFGGDVTYLGQAWAQPIDLLETDIFDIKKEEYKNDTVTCTIIDLDRYIDINSVSEDFLENVKPLSRTVIRKIMARRNGTEEGLEGPCAFRCIEELKYLDGMDEEDWFGKKGTPGIENLLTTWGDGKVNINTAPEAVLLCIPDLRKSAIEGILRYRAGPDGEVGTSDDGYLEPNQYFVGTNNVSNNDFSAIQLYCKFTSSFYKIKGVATRRNGTVRAACSAVVDGNGIICAWQEETLGS